MKMNGSEEDRVRKMIGWNSLQVHHTKFGIIKATLSKCVYGACKISWNPRKVNVAVRNSEPFDITTEISKILAEYQRRAIGPASSEVWERGLAELNKFSDVLKVMPQQPQNISMKTGSDKVKVSSRAESRGSERQWRSMWYIKGLKGENGKRPGGQRRQVLW